MKTNKDQDVKDARLKLTSLNKESHKLRDFLSEVNDNERQRELESNIGKYYKYKATEGESAIYFKIVGIYDESYLLTRFYTTDTGRCVFDIIDSYSLSWLIETTKHKYDLAFARFNKFISKYGLKIIK